MAERGKFIVLEGIDGSGTTTQARKLVSYLLSFPGYHVFGTREPTGFDKGREIKRRLQEDREAGVDPFREKGLEYALLYVEDRREHTEQIIKPLLERGVHVVSDRYKYSTFAYQQAQGRGFDELAGMHESLLVPDLVLILDLPAEEALGRRVADGTPPEVFETLPFQQAVRKNYLSLRDRLPEENIVLINSSMKNIEQVFSQIKAEIDKLYNFR